MKKITLFLFIMILFLGKSIAQLRVDDSLEVKRLQKTTNSEDDAFGVLDKGEMINILGNQGMIGDSYYQNLIYNFRWPKSKGVANSSLDVNAVDDISVMFAHKGNVIDSYSRFRNEDWMAPKGAKGTYHAEDQPAELLAPDGAPRLAHSDIPLTWPKGYHDSAHVFHPAPIGNYASLTDADKELVTKKAAWYDADKNTWRFWPGKYRIDVDPASPTYGKEMPGEFAADRECFAIMDDHNAQLPSVQIGLLYTDQTYSYGRRFAEDIQFYDLEITNTSNKVLDSCWFGYYVDFQFGDVLEETYGSYNTGINPKGYDNAYYQFDYNGTSPGNPEVGVFGMLVLGTPAELGVTDAHFFRDLSGSITPAEDQSIWPVMISDPNSTTLMADKSNYFHGSNVHFDDFSLTREGKSPGPSNWTMFVTTGPFTLQPGEKMKSTVAFSAGKDMSELKSNFEMAQKLYLNHFLGPAAPPSPELHAVAGDKKVTLFWNAYAEKTIDPIAKVADFEGYKIYRSQDQGSTWGEQIKDSKGNLVGYVPIAQFDKKDLIQGVDPFNNFNNLGDNTGLVHMFVDSTVENGVNYSYTITAYDSGSVSSQLESLESAKGTTAADANLVDATPRSNAIGYQDATYTVNHLQGVGKGTVKVNVSDPSKLTGDDYLITFNKAPADTFYITNQTSNAVIAKVPFGTDEMQVSEGINVVINGDNQSGVVKSIVNQSGENVDGESHVSSDGKWYVKALTTNGVADYKAKGSDYEFRFTPSGSYLAGLTGQNKPMLKKYQVPFEIWNVTNPTAPVQINSILNDKNGNQKFDLGEELRIVNNPYVERGDTIGTFNLLYWYYTLTIDTNASSGGRLPKDGETFTLVSYSQIANSDTFLLKVTGPKILNDKETIAKEINKVRVVPNPYIVNAKWEQIENNRRLRFMFLPPECTISIYSVSGELVKKIEHSNNTGDEDWNLTNQSGVEIAFGLYIYVVQTPSGEKTIGKFAIIK